MSNGKPRVLVVDDAALVRLYYRQTLESAGFELDEALNGIEGLEKLLTSTPDLLIVDINMPQMDGLTFIKAIRRRELPAAAIPILVMSTETGAQDMEAAREAGANYYFPKPIGREKLIEIAGLLAGGVHG
jgi:two-component system chemotaxis response regulator CheY